MSTLYRRLSRARAKQSCINRARKEVKLNSQLVSELKSIKKLHPFWGYRRAWAYLRYRLGYSINQKRVYRLMGESGLLNDKQEKKLKAGRRYRSKPKASKPREYLGIDGTKFWVDYWYAKEILSYGICLRNRGKEWRDVLYSGLKKGFFDAWIESSGVKLVSDHGSQPTSVGFMRFCSRYGIEQVFATYNNPKGNADTERVIRTIKEEVVWVNEFETFEEAEGAMVEFVRFYNEK